MNGLRRLCLALTFLLTLPCHADHIIVSGGPALRKWENYRVPTDQHDRWWANFIRSATLRMDELNRAYGASSNIIWMVYQPGYATRSREDSQPYQAWIAETAKKRGVKLVWFNSGNQFLNLLNSRPAGSVNTFDYFGHSNRHCFMFDYGNDIMAASSAWFHERDIPRVNRAIFAHNAYCKSWGCHTGESMTQIWKKTLRVPLEGAKGPTDYTVITYGKLPIVKGSWAR